MKSRHQDEYIRKKKLIIDNRLDPKEIVVYHYDRLYPKERILYKNDRLRIAGKI